MARKLSLTYILKELAFIDADNIELDPGVADIRKLFAAVGLSQNPERLLVVNLLVVSAYAFG